MSRIILIAFLMTLASNSLALPLRYRECEIRAKSDYESVKKKIEDCGVKSIEEALPLLPDVTNYTFVYSSKSAQGAETLFPRVILPGVDAQLLIAFTGRADMKKGHNLEIIQYRAHSKTFEMREIAFDPAGKAPPKFSDANPKSCLECHGEKPRPRWHNLGLMPGFFSGNYWDNYQWHLYYCSSVEYKLACGNPRAGKEPDVNDPNHLEGRQLLEFLNGNFKKGRYAFLSRDIPILHAYQINTGITTWLDHLMSQRLARDLASEDKKKFRPIFWGAILCPDRIEEFVPENLKVKFESYSEIKELAHRRYREHRLRVLAQYRELTGRSAVNGDDTDINDKHKDYQEIAARFVALRYVFKNFKLDPWALQPMSGNSELIFTDKFGKGFGGYDRLPYYFMCEINPRNLGHKCTHEDWTKSYVRAKNIRPEDEYRGWIKTESCDELKSQSLKNLKNE